MNRWREWYFRLSPVVVSLLAIVLAVLVGSVVILFLGKNPLTTYWALLRGMFGSGDRVAASIGRSTPYVGGALALAVAFRAGLFNIGAQGQLLIGALFATVVGTASWMADVPGPIAVTLVILAGAVGGALYGGLPGLLKATTGAHEVITTIMLNSIAALTVGWLVSSLDPVVLRDTSVTATQSKPLAAGARLPTIVDSEPPLHWGVFVAILMCVLTWFVLERTTLGFEITTLGASASAARYSGIKVGSTVVIAMAMSGAFAGVAGAAEVSGRDGFFSPGVFNNVGFDAIAIALLARANPFAILPASLLWGSMLAGSGLMQQEADVGIDVVRIVLALVLLFVAADAIVRWVFRLPDAGDDTTTARLSSGWGSAA